MVYDWAAIPEKKQGGLRIYFSEKPCEKFLDL